ncbi:Mitochondrial group I intron splicing factor CCM1 [Spathaspora sp. JA1]|nr:Mitochondrial group I intron splicing factor CCM1 [Spathaspora sp. JA1]
MLRYISRRSGVAVSTCQRVNIQRNIFVLQDETKKRIIARRKQDQTKSKKSPKKQPQPRPPVEPEKLKFDTLRELIDKTSDALYNKDTVEISQDYIESTADVIYQQVKPKFDPRSIPTPTPSNKSPTKADAAALELPEPISDRLGLAPSLLLNDSAQNWPALVEQLKLGGGFTDLPPMTIHKFLSKIPDPTLNTLLPQIESMYQDANIRIPAKTCYKFLCSLSSGQHVDDSRLQLVDRYVGLIKQLQPLNIDHYETLIIIYCKNNNQTKVNELLEEMKQQGIAMTKLIFSSIMQGYASEGKHAQSMKIFQGMKFLSEQTQPEQREYTAIIASCVKHQEIEEALDLYQEMKSQKIPPNEKILSVLAKGCSESRQFKYKAWNFFFEIYKNGWTPSLKSYETMLYIASKDGDVDLTRALLYKMLETNTLSSRAMTRLFASYGKFLPETERTSPLLIANNGNGMRFRRNIINEIDFSKIVAGFPFLPNSRLTNRRLVSAESSAIWAYMSLNYPGYITNGMVTCYLDVALNHGDLVDFKSRFEQASYLDRTGLPNTRQVVIEEPPTTTQSESTSETITSTSASTSITQSPLLSEMQHLFQDNSVKVPRDTILYNLCLRAAGKFQDFQFLEDTLKEHGEYRLTPAFTNLSERDQRQLDFKFARHLVQAYVDMNLLEDALAVVISSEDNFQWGKHELGNLIGACHRNERFDAYNRLKEVIAKTQIAKGKITRLDHKIYTKKRGY